MSVSKKSPRIKALTKYLEENGDEVWDGQLKPSNYDPQLIVFGSREYLVLSDKEADKRAAEYIKDSIWAFNPTFIASHARIGYDHAITVVKSLQPQCESANEPITALIKNMKSFVSDAIRDDGRGYFISHYDGEENEVKIGNKYFYISCLSGCLTKQGRAIQK